MNMISNNFSNVSFVSQQYCQDQIQREMYNQEEKYESKEEPLNEMIGNFTEDKMVDNQFGLTSQFDCFAVPKSLSASNN